MWPPKKSGQNTHWDKKKQGQTLKKMVQKKFWFKIYLVRNKNLVRKKLWVLKCWLKKKYEVKKRLGSKKVWIQKSFSV